MGYKGLDSPFQSFKSFKPFKSLTDKESESEK